MDPLNCPSVFSLFSSFLLPQVNRDGSIGPSCSMLPDASSSHVTSRTPYFLHKFRASPILSLAPRFPQQAESATLVFSTLLRIVIMIISCSDLPPDGYDISCFNPFTIRVIHVDSSAPHSSPFLSPRSFESHHSVLLVSASPPPFAKSVLLLFP